MVRKMISELVGTMLLVLFGCGTAIAVNAYVNSIFNTSFTFTILIIALAFGLILMALINTIGRVSGCHVNPAVTIAMLIDRRIDLFDSIIYICSQIVGGLCGAYILKLIFTTESSFGANGFDKLSLLPITTTQWVALIVEAILTFVFVLVVLSASDEKSKTENPSLVIGLTLTLVHLFGIPFTGTSVNPARSIGPALVTGGDALSQLWVFIVAPLVGGIIAALFYKFVINYQPKELEVYEEDIDSEKDEEEVEEEAPKKKVVRKTTTTKKRTKKVE
ncbi:MAG: MIP family channel protein [Bacilli bacterium]|nr:MIP family channel protein [Bacilli bacterium]